MSAAVQAMIASANSRVKSSNRQVFVKKATDQKVHENLLKTVEIYLDKPTPTALAELRAAMRLSGRSLQP